MVCSLLFKRLDDLHDIERGRALFHAAAAAYAGIHAVVVRREVHELMHEALTERCIWLVLLLPCAIIVKSEYMQESQQR